MGTRRFQRDEQWRQEFAQEAARIMAEGGIDDFELAKRKARARLNLPAGAPAPRNQEIEQALIEYRSLVDGEEYSEALRALRLLAIDAMEALAEFKPRLVGPVLSGAADASSTITLHLFAEAAEEVAFYLMDNGVRFRDCERRLRTGDGQVERVPGYEYVSNEVPVELLVFSGKARRRTPMSPVDGRPIRRASVGDVRALVDDGGERVAY